ncbi:MAG: response regulator transcription factor [Terracidiphilus sp.]
MFAAGGGAINSNKHNRAPKPRLKSANNDTGPSGSLLRVLVVEDYEPFSRYVCSTLGKRPGLQVVCEVSDGLDAIQKAEELLPDLVVLDVGLPTLNGIEAARRIRKLSPKSKLLFLSQESSADIVQQAFSSGAMGYVVKLHAESELLVAVEAVLRGEKFISPTLADFAC